MRNDLEPFVRWWRDSTAQADSILCSVKVRDPANYPAEVMFSGNFGANAGGSVLT
jgi:hypothetical protein